MDLNQYTLPQLKQLSARIAKELEKRQSVNKAALLKKLKRLAQEHGLALEDIVRGAEAIEPKGTKPKAAAARKTPLAAKYRHPNNRELAWSGRGRRPKWVDAWLANGGSLDALEIAALKMATKPLAIDRSPLTFEPPSDETAGETTTERDAPKDADQRSGAFSRPIVQRSPLLH